MEFAPVVTNKERKERKARRVEFNEAQANKGFDVYVLGKFLGTFPSIKECRDGVINAYNLSGGDECLAYCVRDVRIINKNAV